MKNRDRMISVLFFIFLLILPLQVFAHGEEDDGHDVDSAPWLSEKEHGQDDHGHGDEKGHGHDDEDDHGHGDEGHEHEYEETGANLALLGTFAAINGGFIVFGAVRKLNKKRK